MALAIVLLHALILGVAAAGASGHSYIKLRAQVGSWGLDFVLDVLSEIRIEVGECAVVVRVLFFPNWPYRHHLHRNMSQPDEAPGSQAIGIITNAEPS
jgi:hypothetical protein